MVDCEEPLEELVGCVGLEVGPCAGVVEVGSGGVYECYGCEVSSVSEVRRGGNGKGRRTSRYVDDYPFAFYCVLDGLK